MTVPHSVLKHERQEAAAHSVLKHERQDAAAHWNRPPTYTGSKRVTRVLSRVPTPRPHQPCMRLAGPAWWAQRRPPTHHTATSQPMPPCRPPASQFITLITNVIQRPPLSYCQPPTAQPGSYLDLPCPQIQADGPVAPAHSAGRTRKAISPAHWGGFTAVCAARGQPAGRRLGGWVEDCVAAHGPESRRGEGVRLPAQRRVAVLVRPGAIACPLAPLALPCPLPLLRRQQQQCIIIHQQEGRVPRQGFIDEAWPR